MVNIPKNCVNWTIKLSFFLFITALNPNNLFAQSQVLFLDNFDNGLQDWTVMDDVEPRSGPSQWQVINGMLHQSSNIWSYDPPAEFIYHLGSKVITGSSDWTDYSLNAIVRSTDNDGIGLIVRYVDDKNYYRILLMNDAGNAGSANSAIQRIQKFENGELRTLVNKKVDMAYPSGYFSLTADVRGDTIKAYLNEKLWGIATDSTFKKGSVGLMVYANSGAYFDSVLVHSDPVIYAEPDQSQIVYPVEQNRMPYLQNPTLNSFEVAWRTLEAELGVLEVGLEKGVYTHSWQESNPKKKHHLKANGLEPGQKYFYRIRSGSRTIVEDEVAATVTPPEEQKLSFFVLGDSGVGNDEQHQVFDQMKRNYLQDDVDFLVHVGDVHQGDGARYDRVYFDVYADLLKKFNWFLSIGNHDTYTDNAAPYLDDFYLPNNNPESTERYYSYRWANTFFISLDSNLPRHKGTAQYEFLQKALESEEQKTALWTVVFFHHPPYCEYWPAWGGDVTIQDNWLPLFEEYGVDLVLNGHTHAYERGSLNGTTYVISGGGGGGLDGYARDYEHIDLSTGIHHFSRVDIDKGRLRFQAIDRNGSLVDEFVLEKSSVHLDNNNDKEINSFESKRQLNIRNHPNPFNPSTLVEFELKQASHVTIEVYDSRGSLVNSKNTKWMSSGTHSLHLNLNGHASGTYYVQVTHDYGQHIHPISLIK